MESIFSDGCNKEKFEAIIIMQFFEYVFQDINLRYNGRGIFKNILRYYRLPAVKLLVNYRLTQYLRDNGWKNLVSISRLHLERLNSRYLTLLDDKLDCGSGLLFPHNGPFIINGSSKIGKMCTIHPNVLIGGNRGKGFPTIGNNVFIGNGAKIIGDCKVGDWVFISPGAMITKNIPNESVVGFGINNILSNDGKKHVKLYLK